MAERSTPRFRTVRRDGERVTFLELFFDLVFVLAITQCTALMAADSTWEGLARALLILGVLWWSWVGYAWLTSVVDPEEGAVRLVIFAAMAAMLVVALCVPTAFGDAGLTFAIAYGCVRVAHIALFSLASRGDDSLRRSVISLGAGTAVGVAILVAASFTDGTAQGALWALALALDVATPFFFGADGWHLEPHHFAERHGLIVIVALGESIVAIGVGAPTDMTAGVVTAAVIGVVLVAALWWAYFDVVALLAARALAAMPDGRARNELARDAFSYLHFPIVAGVVLVALGLKSTLAHVTDPLGTIPVVALAGGTALYLLAHVLFKWRTVHRFSPQRVVAALVVLAAIPLLREVDALVAVAVVTAIVVLMLGYETVRFAEARARERHPETPASD